MYLLSGYDLNSYSTYFAWITLNNQGQQFRYFINTLLQLRFDPVADISSPIDYSIYSPGLINLHEDHILLSSVINILWTTFLIRLFTPINFVYNLLGPFLKSSLFPILMSISAMKRAINIMAVHFLPSWIIKKDRN